MAAKSRWHQLLPERRIRRWQAGPGGTVLAQVQQQMGTAMQAAGMKLYATMRLACVSLASNVYRAQAAPPIPGRAAQRLYAMALTGLSHAASDCRAAISVRSSGEQSRPQVNASLLTRTRAEFAAVALTLNKATGGLPSMIVAG